jgi:hypothetical protein
VTACHVLHGIFRLDKILNLLELVGECMPKQPEESAFEYERVWIHDEKSGNGHGIVARGFSS